MLKLLLVLFLTAIAFGDPAPLGLELGKATVKDARKKYSLQNLGKDKYTLGPMFRIPVSQVNIDDLTDVMLVFDRKGVLQAVALAFPDYKFEEIYRTLRKKYRLVKSENSLVGDKYAEFEDGNSVIVLESGNLGFITTVIYARKEFLKVVSEIEEREEREKKKRLERGL
jgi:hypothetical protein